MALLELDRIYAGSPGRDGRHLLHGVSLSLAAGELVAVWGARRSGRSTLMRIAAGLQVPEGGTVRYAGQRSEARWGVPTVGGITFCRTSFRGTEGRSVAEQVERALLMRGQHSPTQAALRTAEVLDHLGVGHCSAQPPSRLAADERVRASIARAVAGRPRVLVLDEPAIGLGSRERDQLLALLHALARDGLTVLMSASETTELTGSYRALWLSNGALRGRTQPRSAAIIPLRGPDGTLPGAETALSA